MNKSEIINSIFFPRKSPNKVDDKDLLVPVSSKEKVGVRLFLADKSFPTVIYFHANAEIAQEYDAISSYYHEHKMNLIVCGYRGYGLSDGEPSKDNLLNDSLRIFDYINDYLVTNKYTNKFIIMGRSLGSAAVCEIISKHDDKIDGAIIESGFATEYPLLKLFNLDPDKIDYKLEDGFMNLAKIKAYKKPLYVIHSDLDEIVPFSQADIIMLESGSVKKDIFKVNGAGHNNVIMIASEHYFVNIKSFIDSI